MIWARNIKYLNNAKFIYRKCFATAGLRDFWCYLKNSWHKQQNCFRTMALLLITLVSLKRNKECLWFHMSSGDCSSIFIINSKSKALVLIVVYLLGMLTWKKHPQIKLQRLRKLWIWTFGWLVHQTHVL